jgi:hypothetical protein
VERRHIAILAVVPLWAFSDPSSTAARFTVNAGIIVTYGASDESQLPNDAAVGLIFEMFLAPLSVGGI